VRGHLLACAAVLFDSDGVLVDSDDAVARSWSRWAVSLGLDPEQVSAMVHGRRAEDTVALLVEQTGRTEATERINAYELADADEVTAVPGAVQLTAALRAGTWALVTSATASLAQARLRAAGIALPQVVVTADDVRRGKPAPDGYLQAAQRLGQPIGSCVVAEDSTSGIAAARAAGAAAVLGVGERALATDADVVVPDLTAVRATGEGLLVDLRAALRVPPT
jgi:sugar-phosphatase